LTRARSILDAIGRTPLVLLARLGAGLPAPVPAKCEHMNPDGSVRDRIALSIVRDAERRGALGPGMTIVEATAGDTGLGPALMAAARGYGLVRIGVCLDRCSRRLARPIETGSLAREVVAGQADRARLGRHDHGRGLGA